MRGGQGRGLGSVGVEGEGLDRVVAQVKERRAENSHQSDQVVAVIEIAAEIQQIEDFLLSEKGFSFDEVVIQAVATQGGFVVLHAGKCSKQNHNVARLGSAEQLSSVRIFVFAANAGGGVGQHRRDAAGNPICFTPT